MKPIKGWAVARDDEIYCIAHSRSDAMDIISDYRPGSKHRWRAIRVRISPLKRTRLSTTKGETQ